MTIEKKQEDLESDVLLALFEYSQRGGDQLPADHISSLLPFEMGLQRVKLALRSLESGKLIYGSHNSITGSKYEITDKGYRQIEEKLAADPGGVNRDVNGSEAPASDRIVGFDHNQREFREAREQVTSLSTQIRSANDLGDMTPRAAQVAAVEVEDIGSMMDQEFVRPSELWRRARSTLGWIGREAANTVVGAAALALLALLASILGFPVPF